MKDAKSAVFFCFKFWRELSKGDTPMKGGVGGDKGGSSRRGSIEAGSGAADAGLQTDDIIVEVEGDPIDSMTDLVVAVRQFQPGDTVEVVYLRDGQRRTASVTLGERPGSS